MDIAFDYNQIELNGKIKFEVAGHLRLLKQEFKRFFPDLRDIELLELNILNNPFPLNKDILCKELQEESLCNENKLGLF